MFTAEDMGFAGKEEENVESFDYANNNNQLTIVNTRISSQLSRQGPDTNHFKYYIFLPKPRFHNLFNSI